MSDFQLDAIKLTEAVKERLINFALENCFVRDRKLSEICRKIWSGHPEKGGLISDLWVEGAFPAKTAEETLDDLVNQRKFNADLCNYLDQTEAVPRHRSLYVHQREAILKAQIERPNGTKPAIVVTAGTGAGKTESFLLPILNDLFNRRDELENGMKCIILYPMNALVNDQVDRLYKWLKVQSEITLFHFTSETPEDKKRADQWNVPKWEEPKQKPCRMRTRQEARGLEARDGSEIQGGPIPDILITNYSMLEYMLCRPQDAVFFSQTLRAIVLDEAHLYTGTLAAEITLLLRRVYERCGISPDQILQFATSATLGEGLKEFASNLFTKKSTLIEVIEGQQARVNLPDQKPPIQKPTAADIASQKWLYQPTIKFIKDSAELAVDHRQYLDISEKLSLLVEEKAVEQAQKQTGYKPAILLYETLKHSPLIHRIENILWDNKYLSLNKLAEQIWDTTELNAIQATTILLQMGAAARRQVEEYPLLPHRIHLLARSTDGLVVCLNKDCTGDDDLKLEGLGCVSAGLHDHCPYCQSATLSLYRCSNCGEWVLAGNREDMRFHPVASLIPSDEFQLHIQFFTLREISKNGIALDTRTGERTGSKGRLIVYDIATKETKSKKCPQCDASAWGTWKSFISSTPVTISVLAESTLAELPEYPDTNNLWLPARGRRILAFSDSRREAARLGPSLTKQHETQLIRTAIVKCLQERPVANKATISFRQQQIAQLERQLMQQGLEPELQQMLETDLEQTKQQLNEMIAGGSISSWTKVLAQVDLLHEILDEDSAEKHKYENWSQKQWEHNLKQIVEIDRLESFLAREFASPSRRYISLETSGLAEITYPNIEQLKVPEGLLGILPAKDVREKIKESWTQLLALLCDSLRSNGVVTLGTDEKDRAYQFGYLLIGRWCAEKGASGKRLENFVGRTNRQKRLWFAETVLKKCGLIKSDAEKYAPELLGFAFRQLKDNAEKRLLWLKKDERQSKDKPVSAIRIFFPKLGLRRPMKLYRSRKTGHIWFREAMGCAPEFGCDDLEQVTADDLDEDPRVRRQRHEFKSSRVFSIGLWAEEHSAQLSPENNRRLQNLFKYGIRNILSSTTTLELGIDIGGLNAALMSNVPPGKANYLQRAGRAGRRTDGSSIVTTFCRLRPFDREVFLRFGDYLSSELRRPNVFLDRKRVIQRHGHAFLLGEFFRSIYPPGTHVGAMRAFGEMGQFCGVELPDLWKKGEKQKPSIRKPERTLPAPNVPWWNLEQTETGLDRRFIDYLTWISEHGESELRPAMERLYHGTGIREILANWSEFIEMAINDFKAAIKNWRDDYDALLSSWKSIDLNSLPTIFTAKGQSNAIRYQLNALYETTVIEALADQQFLPRYGFPIGVQKLRVIHPDEKHPGKIREEDQYRLERPGLLALGEYVPGSQLLVGGKLITSHGLLKHWTGANLNKYMGLQGQYTYCKNGHFYYEISGSLGVCPICGGEKGEPPTTFLLPKHGFTSAAWDPPKQSTDIERVGSIEQATITFNTSQREGAAESIEDNFGEIQHLTARYREDGEILVYNRGEYKQGFAICLKCGYADSERKPKRRGKMELPPGFDSHAPLTSPKENVQCWRSKKDVSVLRNQTLAAKQTTDVFLLDFSECLKPYNYYPIDTIGTERRRRRLSELIVWTLAHALKLAGAKMLELDSRELGVLVIPAGRSGEGFGAVLYDNVPGGAGHVLELLKLGRDWLEKGYEILYVNKEHHTRCKTACLDCLLTFDAQEAMSRGLLNRSLSIEVLDCLLNNEPLPTPQDLCSL